MENRIFNFTIGKMYYNIYVCVKIKYFYSSQDNYCFVYARNKYKITRINFDILIYVFILL